MKLKRSLYGLKQSSRSFNRIFHEAPSGNKLRVDKLGSLHLHLWCKRKRTPLTTYSCVYVDDLFVTVASRTILEHTKNKLKELFTMAELGAPEMLLGMTADGDGDSGTSRLSRVQYTKSVLK